ncbi:uncharacterized protein Z518_00491 [Rhinocladiella mackenziei CBS 650.93]|uniref:Uncharacterized protein n=1 Tax=Rhinocladiella mackenziei CBS 650.93 TaxID=1442369 RepID=A0A0D2J145_9EURO|nr:uncharacterized protein Z518_00491 [Rhinocladiella mackenziei CBS 650.93]KIX09411.1 hypothetical protein Z518_00491 [Rhinocladiella mackenziei CBS 650.93]
MSSFALAFPTSWTVDSNGRLSTTRQVEPRLDPSSFEPSRKTTILAPESLSLTFSGASKYPTDFPSSWLFSAGSQPSRAQQAASTPEQDQRHDPLISAQRHTTTYSKLSNLSTSSTLRPTVSAANQLSATTDDFGYHGTNLKEKLLEHISQHSSRSSPKLPHSISLSTNPPLSHRQPGNAEGQAPDSQAVPTSRPGSSNLHSSGISEPAQAQYDDESNLSDGSGAGDAPYRPFDFPDNYSIVTAGTTITK